MRATIWGCRGSLASPGPATVRSGGNTTSVEVRTSTGALIVLDAGTGIRALGAALGGDHPEEIHLLLTHMHLDHVEGLGFFAPLFDERCRITIWGPDQDGHPLDKVIRSWLSPPLFPLEFEELAAEIRFEAIGMESWELGEVSVTSAFTKHPGRTLGYRLEEHGAAVGFIPDNELGLDPEAGLALAADVDVLLHDAQYTQDEYRDRVGWGHTDIGHFAAFLDRARPRRALMFHHDPSHDDDTLEGMRDAASQLAARDVELAREGLAIDVAWLESIQPG
jgi:phosphoribosyl 1,2-cyclic phosphodiesterase